MFIVPIARPTSDLVRFVDDTLDRYFSNGNGHAADSSAAPARRPALDLLENDRSYTVTLDLPGVLRDDVHVAIEGKRITVQAEVRSTVEHKEAGKLVWRERGSTRFERSFVLPQEVDQSESSAKLENGVLALSLAKRVPHGAGKLTIN